MMFAHSSSDRPRIDDEVGIEEPHSTGMFECRLGFSQAIPPAGTENIFSYDDFLVLLEDVRILKRSAIDSRRQAEEIEHIRSKLADMKIQVEQLAQYHVESFQDLKAAMKTNEGSIKDAKKQLNAELLAELPALSEMRPKDDTGEESLLARAAARGVEEIPHQQVHPKRSQVSSCSAVSSAAPLVETFGRLSVSAHVLEAETLELYPFKPSTWDLAVFIGTRSLGIGGSAIAFVLLLMSIAMQVVFVGIVWVDFGVAKIDETTIEDARRWRADYAHDYEYMDLESGISLVSRVCQNDNALQIASSQQILHDHVRNYLRPEATGYQAFLVGKALCIVALVCWFLMVSKEIHDSGDLVRAMMHVTRGIAKLDLIERPGLSSTYRIARVSRNQLIFTAIISGYRLLVVAGLAYGGTLFLVYTIDTTDLVLNAVALDIILNMDDLLFAALATANAKHLVVKLEPLCMPPWPHRNGVDLKAASMIVMIPSVVVIVYCTMISPMVDDLGKVEDALCGNTQNFVYSSNQLKMTIFATTEPCANTCQKPTNSATSFRRIAVEEALKHGRVTNSSHAIWVGDYHALKDQKTFSFAQTVAKVSQGKCVDDLHGPYLNYVRHVVGNESISDCSDVKLWCSSPSFQPEWQPDGGKGLMARLFCPNTCECGNPGGNIAFITGCPATCMHISHPVYAQHLNLSYGTCPERSRNQLTNSSDWMAWAAQLRQFAAFTNDKDIVSYADQMIKHGCGQKSWSVYKSAASSLCMWANAYSTVFKGIAIFCPNTCVCHKTIKPNCPISCIRGHV